MGILRVALAQTNMSVGNIQANCQRIIQAVEQAREQEAHVVVLPEMSVTGYPPEDLLLKPDFIRAAEQSLKSIAPKTRGITAIVGTPHLAEDLYNAAAIFHNGVLVDFYYKQYLPNYGVFDENRYFQAGRQNNIFIIQGIRVGVSICEDIWYPAGPPGVQAYQGAAEVLINISASPYYAGKGAERARMLATRASDSSAFVAYCNLVGGQDELIFDGQSMVFAPNGDLIARGIQFAEDMVIANLDTRHVVSRRLFDPRRQRGQFLGEASISVTKLDECEGQTAQHNSSSGCSPELSFAEEVYEALVLGTRDYVCKNQFDKVVIGLSGGIDSSLVATIAVDALGSDRVVGISMPTRFSSDHSLSDARHLSENLNIEYRVIPIDDTFQSFLEMLIPHFDGRGSDVTEENMQARIRGIVLMSLSNKFGWLVLTTGNKSETGVGYSTLYGDTAGGFAAIKDVPKTLVYDLCRMRNQRANNDLIPENVLLKPPSAELRPEQKDSDSLPDYYRLDAILRAYVEDNYSIDELMELGFASEEVEKVIRLTDRSEYKRRQSPPGIKIMPRAFGKDWRLPITNAYRPIPMKVK